MPATRFARARGRLLGATAGLAYPLVIASSALAEPPRFDPDRPVECRRDANHQLWRVQCDSRANTCLYAPDSELDEKGNRDKPLERVEPCSDASAPFMEGKQALVPGIAEAPYGWLRDERGRVLQTNFDLHKRMYVGGGYSPLAGGADTAHRGYVDFALLRFESTSGIARYRLRLFEGEFRLGPVSAEGVALRFDTSERRTNPLFRVTTFFGRPRRTDIHINPGFWMELGRAELFSRSYSTATHWRIATFHGSVDLWQSADSYSYVRLRGGASLEHTSYASPTIEDRAAIVPGSAVDADLTFDPSGFHHLTATASFDLPQFYSLTRGIETSATRIGGELGYEAIVLAINDQPVTLRVSGTVSKRDDIVDVPRTWSIAGNAGLRFSLWAPPRQR